MNPVPYDVLRGSLKTGDLALFSGKGRVSDGIKAITNSPYSHVGMIVLVEEYGMLCLWESTTLSTLADLDTGCRREGVQLVPLSTRVAQYGGSIVIRKLSEPLTQGQVDSLMAFRRQMVGVPYETKFLELLRSAYDGPGGSNSEDLSSVFCSEMTAEAYQRMGLVLDAPPSNEYTPADFSEAREDVAWATSLFRLGSEITVLA